jgi:ribosomal protein S18 acetylase RimI-like enzyme
MERAKIRVARLSDAPHIARLHVAAWQSTYQGILSPSYLASLSWEDRAIRWKEILSLEHSMVVVLVDSQETILGFASCGSSRAIPAFDGEIYTIYMDKKYQRMGYGKELLLKCKDMLLNCSINSFYLWVLEQNHQARRFYEKNGGVEVGRKTEDIGGTSHIELAYGWP